MLFCRQGEQIFYNHAEIIIFLLMKIFIRLQEGTLYTVKQQYNVH